jgi:hypothetical protein
MSKRKKPRDDKTDAGTRISLNAVKKMLRDCVYKNAILTLSPAPAPGQAQWDIEKADNGDLILGTDPSHTFLFWAKLIRLISENDHIGLILRSFTERIHQPSGLPINELRGFLLKRDGNSVSLYCLSEGDLFSAQNTDFKTRAPLTPETAVEYCEYIAK